MVLIVAVLILHVQQNIQTAQGAGGKTDNIDKTESLVFQQEANGGFEIAFYHGNDLSLKSIRNCCKL
jgi:hypothetical protein